MILDRMLAYVALAAALILGALLGVQTWRLHSAQISLAQAQSAIALERQQSSDAAARLQAQIRLTEQSLNESATLARKQTDEQLQVFSLERDALVRRVRLAEARAAAALNRVPDTSTAPSIGSAPPGDSRAELLATIGEQDVVEAERADIIRIHLVACYNQYAEAREALNRYR